LTPNIQLLLLQLTTATDAGKIRWNDGGSGAYIAMIGENSWVKLFANPAGGYIMELVSKNGCGIMADFWSTADTVESFCDLYNKARRQALHLEEQLTAFLAELDKLTAPETAPQEQEKPQ
jgi:hypothetical protein